MLRASLVSLAFVVPLFVAAPSFAQAGEGEGEGEVAVGEGEGEVAVGEGEGEAGFPVPAEVAALCAKQASCDATVVVADCEQGNAEGLATSAGVGDPACTALNDAFLAFADCSADLTCEQLADDADPTCAAQTTAFNDALNGPGGFCLQGQAPVAGWNCSAGFFGTDDGCDCGCGAADPDCAGAGVSTAGEGVGVEGCEFCYDTTGQLLPAPDDQCGNAPAEGEGEVAEGEGEAAEGEGDGGEGEGDTGGGLCSSTTATVSPIFAALGVALVAIRRRRR